MERTQSFSENKILQEFLMRNTQNYLQNVKTEFPFSPVNIVKPNKLVPGLLSLIFFTESLTKKFSS